MGLQTTFCSLCGGPFSLPKSLWTCSVVVLTSGSSSGAGDADGEADVYDPVTPLQAGSGLLRFRAEHLEGSKFSIRGRQQEGSEIDALTVKRADDPGRAFLSPLYVPVHAACLQLAEEVFAERLVAAKERRSAGETEDRRDGRIEMQSGELLWRILWARFGSTSYQHNGGVLPCPRDYFGGRLCRNVEWEGGDDPEAARVFEADPREAQPLPLTGKDKHALLKQWQDLKGNYGRLSSRVSPETANRSRILQILGDSRVGDTS